MIPPHHHIVRRFLRRYKHIAHGLTIAVIAASLCIEGGKAADWAFLSLSILCEVA